MDGIDQVVFAVDFVDVDVVAVSPVGRPRLVVYPVVAAVVEAAIFAARYTEGVLAAEVLVEVLLADAARIAITAVALSLLILSVLLAGYLLLLLLFGDLLLLFRLLLLYGRPVVVWPRLIFPFLLPWTDSSVVPALHAVGLFVAVLVLCAAPELEDVPLRQVLGSFVPVVPAYLSLCLALARRSLCRGVKQAEPCRLRASSNLSPKISCCTCSGVGSTGARVKRDVQCGWLALRCARYRKSTPWSGFVPFDLRDSTESWRSLHALIFVAVLR